MFERCRGHVEQSGGRARGDQREITIAKAGGVAVRTRKGLGHDGLVVVESGEDVLRYDTGHIPGAIKVDWHTELNDEVPHRAPSDYPVTPCEDERIRAFRDQVRAHIAAGKPLIDVRSPGEYRAWQSIFMIHTTSGKLWPQPGPETTTCRKLCGSWRPCR